MRRIIVSCCAVMAGAAVLGANSTLAQMMPGGGGQMPGRPTAQPIDPSGEPAPSSSSSEKPDIAAKKAFKAGMKSLDKAKEYEAVADSTANPDKKANAIGKMDDAYDKALDQFTEALSNKGDMVEAWDNVGYVHLHLRAYREAIDDYNHVLGLKPELQEAIEHRGEAYLAIDRLDDAKIAYMDLYNHSPALAAQLMQAMQKWLADHRTDAHGMRAADVDAFDKWLQERDGIAKQTASLPH
jgi:tetratricopeptide (TPR) repeat protein